MKAVDQEIESYRERKSRQHRGRGNTRKRNKRKEEEEYLFTANWQLVNRRVRCNLM